jgi:hypothetical protein
MTPVGLHSNVQGDGGPKNTTEIGVFDSVRLSTMISKRGTMFSVPRICNGERLKLREVSERWEMV